MQNSSLLLSTLIKALCCLPGVGPKTGQRMAFYLLQQDKAGANHLAQTLLKALDKIGHCQQCRTLTEQSICATCANPARDDSKLCVVETPADVWVVDQSAVFKGHYFVLHGLLSPLDGIGPEELDFNQLEQRLSLGTIKEIILATNATVEGETTAHYIATMAKKLTIKTTRIAYGVPIGGELEFIDSGTLLHAFNGRIEI